MTEARLFPLAPINAAREVLKGILDSVEDAIEKRLESAPDSSASHGEDIAKLNAIVQDLRTELGESRSSCILGPTCDTSHPQTKPDVTPPTTPTKRGHLWTSSSRVRTRRAFFRLCRT